jgi:RimJ/RimL family protein N-acetyltransferase
MKKNIVDSLYKNLLFQVTYFAPHVPAQQIIKNDYIIKITDIQDDTFNMVLGARFTQKNVEEKIDEVTNIFNTKNLPFSWWIGSNDTPFNLKEILISKGFVPKENDYGMYLDLEKYTPKKLDHLTIKQVSNTQELKEFCDIHEKTYTNPEAYDIIFSKIPSSSYQDKSPYRFYTGYFDGKPVTTGVLVFHADVVGIYFILTLKEERRKGYATEMMNYLLFIAKKEHQKIAVLQASEEGKKVYEKMGFNKCCIFQEFTLKNKQTTLFIETERLILKPFDEKDITYLKTLLKDPDEMKFSIDGPYTDDNEIQKLIDKSFETQKKYGIGLISVFLKKTNTWIGFCGLFKEKVGWDFGYRFLKNYWGLGYAQEAVKACCFYFKKYFSNEKIYCYIESENIASIKIAEKCSMHFLGKDIFHGLKVFKYQLLE